MADRRLFRFRHTTDKLGNEVTALERRTDLGTLPKATLVDIAEKSGVKAEGDKGTIVDRLDRLA